MKPKKKQEALSYVQDIENACTGILSKPDMAKEDIDRLVQAMLLHSDIIACYIEEATR